MGWIGAASSVLGGIGSVVSNIKSGQAANDAAKNQSNAIDKIKAYTNENMDPALLQQKALEADTERAKNQLALQAQIDPELAKQRTVSEQMLSNQLSGIGNSASDEVAAQAASEALTQTPGAAEGKAQLIQAALKNLQAGATLPPDLQAELMQAGLQQSAGVTGGAPGAGAASGGTTSSILTRVLGSAGVNLQQQREQQAQQLLTSASNLDAQRAQILGNLFPKLQQQQMGNISGTAGVLSLGNSMLPQAGLSGTQVASDWLARVGAMNQLSGQKAAVQANGALATGQANANMWGSIASLGQAATSPQTTSGISSFFNSVGSGAGTGASGNFAG